MTLNGALFRIKRLHLEPRRVLARWDRANKAILDRFGAYTRRTAQQSLRYRKHKSAPAGDPPFVHIPGSSAGLKDIRFATDARRWSVIVGPLKYHGKKGRVPKTLEYGGLTRGTFLRRTGRGKTRIITTETKTVYIRPHPFMRPAAAANLAALPRWLRNSLHT